MKEQHQLAWERSQELTVEKKEQKNKSAVTGECLFPSLLIKPQMGKPQLQITFVYFYYFCRHLIPWLLGRREYVNESWSSPLPCYHPSKEAAGAWLWGGYGRMCLSSPYRAERAFISAFPCGKGIGFQFCLHCHSCSLLREQWEHLPK